MTYDHVFMKAYGKINLALDVVGTREDGYHLVDMIMQTVNLYDKLEFKKTETGEINISSNIPYLSVNKDNIIYKAVRLIFDEFDIKDGLDIKLEKKIPVSAGMAGGSTDAATTLMALNKMYDLGINKNALMERGLKLGADVPYCILRGTARATGIGEEIKRIKKLPQCNILMAKPKVNISTGDIYKELDAIDIEKHPDVDQLIKYIENGDVKGMAENMGNVLELVTIPKCPVINDYKEIMKKHNAAGTMMSGSGPTVFGIFEGREDAFDAKREIRSLNNCSVAYVTDLYDPRMEK